MELNSINTIAWTIILTCACLGCSKEAEHSTSSARTPLHFDVLWNGKGITASGSILSDGTMESGIQTIDGQEFHVTTFTVDGKQLCRIALRSDGDELSIDLDNRIPVSVEFDVRANLYSDDKQIDAAQIPPGSYMIVAKRAN